jgi:hypothetical protein
MLTERVLQRNVLSKFMLSSFLQKHFWTYVHQTLLIYIHIMKLIIVYGT